MKTIDKTGAGSAPIKLRRVRKGDGREVVLLSRGSCVVAVAAEDWLYDQAAALKTAGRKGVLVLPTERAALKEAFEKAAVEDGRAGDDIGWAGKSYVFGDGEIAPKAGEAPLGERRDEAERWGCRGSAEDWRSGLAVLLRGQALPRFSVCAAFVGPLLDLVAEPLNPGIELVGAPGGGKSTLQRLAASAWGPPDLFGRTWNTTLNGLGEMMRSHRDGLLTLDEARHLDASRGVASQREMAEAAIFALADGVPKVRLGQAPEADRMRLLWLSSANVPLAERMRRLTPDQAEAAASRVVSLPSDAGAGLGVFDAIPDADRDAHDLIAGLIELTSAHYGKPARKFVRRLCRDRAKDEAALRERVKGLVATFVRRGEGAGAIAARNARVIGLVHAAGTLAIEYEVLPPKWKASVICKEIARRLEATTPETPARTILRLANSKRVKHLPQGEPLPDLNDRQLARGFGFKKDLKGGTYYLVTPRQLRRLVKEPDQFVQGARGLGCLKTHAGRDLTIKCAVRSGADKDRVHAFDLEGLRSHK